MEGCLADTGWIDDYSSQQNPRTTIIVEKIHMVFISSHPSSDYLLHVPSVYVGDPMCMIIYVQICDKVYIHNYRKYRFKNISWSKFS